MIFYFLSGIKLPINPAIVTGTIQLNPKDANGNFKTKGILILKSLATVNILTISAAYVANLNTLSLFILLPNRVNTIKVTVAGYIKLNIGAENCIIANQLQN